MRYSSTARRRTPGRQMTSGRGSSGSTSPSMRSLESSAESSCIPSPRRQRSRVEDAKTLLTDGPFIEAKEYLGGFYLLEAENLDVAIELAARIPAARIGGAVEIRPLVEP